ncbi:hypothetical protein FIBSPDRAFT_921414 [Athelia psychrophila]|uniref:Peptidase C14 caspase domain-containing protein n=1 Tax=Athelia psychrophila TaxID=1759441 RepID=A0A166D5C0_9AGAM|nr:hypothetical protein FIBSPDRAFT_921414 [Fibularhizoctonia sp. CBS 109695]
MSSDARSEIAIPVPPPRRRGSSRYPPMPTSSPPFYDPNGTGTAGISSAAGSRPRTSKDPVRSARSPGLGAQVPGTASGSTSAPEQREKGGPAPEYREKGPGYRERRRLPVQGHPEYEVIVNRQQQQQHQPFPQQRERRPQLQQGSGQFVNHGSGDPNVNLNPGFALPHGEHHQRPEHHHRSEHRTHTTHTHHRSRTTSQTQALAPIYQREPPHIIVQGPEGQHHESHHRRRAHSQSPGQQPPQYEPRQESRSHSREHQSHSHSREHQSRSHSREHQNRSHSREHQNQPPRRPRTTSSSRYIDHAAHVQHSPLPEPVLLPQPADRQSPPRYPTQQGQGQRQHAYPEPPAEARRIRRQTLPGGQVLDQTYQYSKCTGRKRALFVGINYKGLPNELEGCVNDAKNMCKFMMNRHGYKAEDIVLLTDDSEHARQLPTKKNITDAMRWLVRGAKAHDSLFFHYSGHGGQTRDLDGDEIDGYDEVIFPVDYLTAGHLVDDEMNKLLVRRLPRACRLTAVFDSCHSGTALGTFNHCHSYAGSYLSISRFGLCGISTYTFAHNAHTKPFGQYHSNGRLKGHQVMAGARVSKATEGDVISFSACKDDQTSADTQEQGVAVGAMSYAFMLSLHQNPNQSYTGLLKSIREILIRKYSQKCQLSSSHPIIPRKICTLDKN